MGPTIIIEGIDRIGKDTLISNIIETFGYYSVVHFKPPALSKVYDNIKVGKNEDENIKMRKFLFQRDSFDEMFKLIRSNAKLIFNRSHLGEFVYSSMYRKYPGNYIYQIEKENSDILSNIYLILLTTSNFSILENDGKSLDWNNKELEQRLFVDGFSRSNISNKIIIDVYDQENKIFKKPEDIIIEITKRYTELKLQRTLSSI